MATESSPGILATFTKATMKPMSVTDMDRCIGSMDHTIKGIGEMACSTARVSFIRPNMALGMEFLGITT